MEISSNFQNLFCSFVQILVMRVISVSTLKRFYETYPTSKTALETWYKTVKTAEWKTLSDIKKDFNSVDYVGNKRYVFNIKGNDFRLVAKILLGQKIIFIRFIGTHKDYDNVDCKTI